MKVGDKIKIDGFLSEITDVGYSPNTFVFYKILNGPWAGETYFILMSDLEEQIAEKKIK